MLCIAGDIQTAGLFNASVPRSGMSVWRVQGSPSLSGYSGGFNMQRVSGLNDFAQEEFCGGGKMTIGAPTAQNTKPSTVINVNSTLYLGVSCMVYGRCAS